jgi:hypothetical protein
MMLRLNSPVKCPKAGLCKLTGTRGPYVKSHIIPASLTRLPTYGQKVVEAGIGLGVKKRFVSWYNNELVTRVGENILEEIDTPAIDALREHKLIWSSWGIENRLKTSDLLAESDGLAFRLVKISRANELQLFFLSVVWRSAATQRPEFSDVQLPADIVEDLRRRVHAKDPGPFSDYPVQLFQIISKGILHNRVPLLERTVVELEAGDRREMDYVRIYFDGLVAHVHVALREAFDKQYLGTCLCSGEDTIVFAHEFDASRTAANIKEMVTTVVKEGMEPPSRLTSIAAAVRDARKI